MTEPSQEQPQICERCGGTGQVVVMFVRTDEIVEEHVRSCPSCNGNGILEVIEEDDDL